MICENLKVSDTDECVLDLNEIVKVEVEEGHRAIAQPAMGRDHSRD